jgi:hypothetical protein
MSPRRTILLLIALPIAVAITVLSTMTGLSRLASNTAAGSGPSVSNVAASEWGLVIDGFVQSPLALTLDDLMAMPPTTVYTRLYCVGLPTRPLEVGNWTGVRLGYLLQQAGVSPEAIKVALYASDGFTSDLSLSTAMRDDVILAYEKDGQPLAQTVRMVVPGKWGYKWIKSVTHIELVNYDFLGSYESIGYSDEADFPDGDGDRVPDAGDNCPSVSNLDQQNSDGQRRPNGAQVDGDWASNPSQDNSGDACDTDDDNDALPDSAENEASCPYRLVADSDGDRVLDGYEVAQGADPCNAAGKPGSTGSIDSDGDGIIDRVERSGYNTCASQDDAIPGYGACAAPADSDGDGCADWIEIMDVNGDGQSNVLDGFFIAKRAFDLIPPSDSDALLDIDKNGAVNILDALVAAKNSSLIRPHDQCTFGG